MTGGFTDGGCGLVKTAARGDVELAADDGLNAGGIGLFIKIYGAEHVAVIRDGNGRHGKVFRLFEEFMKTNHAVKKTVLSMDMKMDKIRMFHG